MRCPAKLIGGRYDGDKGTMQVPRIPEFLKAYPCRNGSEIHWTSEERHAGWHHPEAELYAHTGFDGEHDEMPVAVYVVAPDSVPIDTLLMPELANA